MDFIIQYNNKGEYIRHFGGKQNKENPEDEKLSNAHGIALDTRDPKSLQLIATSRATQQFKTYTLEGEYKNTIDAPGASICRPVIKGENLYFAVIVTKSWWAYDGMTLIFDKNNKAVSAPGGEAPLYKDGKLQKSQHIIDTFLSPHDVCVDNNENIFVTQWNSGRTFPIMLERV